MSAINPSAPLPNDQDSEKAILAFLMLGSEAIHEVVTVVRPGWFYNPVHASIYEMAVELIQQDVRPDVLALTRAARVQKVADIISPGLLSEIYGFPCPNWRYYAGNLENASYRRALWDSGKIMQEAATDLANDPAAELDKAAGKLADMMSGNVDSTATAAEVWGATMDMIQQNLTAPPGFKTGIESLDKHFRQWLPGNVYLVAARPGQGKTAMATRLLESWAIDQQIPTLFISLEMSRQQLGARLMAQIGRLPLGVVLGDSGEELAAWQQEAINDASPRIVHGAFWVEDRSSLTYRQVVASIRRHVRRNKVRIVLLDYVQRVAGLNARQDNLEKLEQTSLALADIAKSENILIVALAQLNRDVSKRKSSRPLASDLKGAGQLEQDATGIIGLHRPSSSIPYEDLQPDEQSAWRTEERYREYSEAVILKNRYGATDIICPLSWIGEHTRFDSWT